MSETVTTVITETKTETKPAVKTDNPKKTLILRGVAVLAVVGIAYFIYNFLFYVGTDNAQIMANTVILTSRVSGFVTKVNVEDGQKVKSGEVIAEIQARDYQSRTSQSENELGATNARVRDAQLSYERIENLYKAGAVSLQQRDSAFANYQELARRTKALQDSLNVSKNSLDDTIIRAPADGVIAKKAAEIGMLAAPGMPLFGFVSDETRWVVANFKETDLDRLKVGQKVKIEVDAISGRSFQGEIKTFYPATGAIFSLLPPDNATGNFTKVVQRVPTRIEFKDLKKEDIDLLKAGLSAVVDVRVR